MSRETFEGRGFVCMNPLGPHFYLDVVEGERPRGAPDLLTDVMNRKLTELDEEHGWPIEHGYIKGHERIVEVRWTPNEDASYGVDLDFEPLEVNEEWYSRRQIREYNYGDHSKQDIVML